VVAGGTSRGHRHIVWSPPHTHVMCLRSLLPPRTGLHLADWTPRADLHRQHQRACQPLSRKQPNLDVLFYAGALSLLLAPAVADRSISLCNSTRRLREKTRQIRTIYSKITWVKETSMLSPATVKEKHQWKQRLAMPRIRPAFLLRCCYLGELTGVNCFPAWSALPGWSLVG
jgi:hypothetical protein